MRDSTMAVDEAGTVKTVSRNAAVLMASSVVSLILRVVYVGALSRYVGAEGFGRISTATALVSLSMLIVNFGLDTLVVRDVASSRSRAATYVTNVTVVRLALTAVFAVCLAMIVEQSPYHFETKIIIAIYALAYVLDSLSDVARSLFESYQRMEYRALVDIVRVSLNVGASLLGIYLGWSIVAIVSISALSSLVTFLVSIAIVYRRFVHPCPRINLDLCLQIVRSSLPFLILICISVVTERAGTIFLSWNATAEEVGIYSAALFPITSLLLVAAVFYQTILPVFSQYQSSSADYLGKSYKLSFKIMLLVGFPMGTGVMLVSEEVVSLIYGQQFREAAVVMNILAIQLFTMVGYVNGAYLIAVNRQQLFVRLRVLAVVLTVSLCLLLIPEYGNVGAAVAVTVPAVVDFGLYTFICHRCNGQLFPWTDLLKIGASTAIMGVVGILALSYDTHLVVLVLLGLATYFVSLLAVRAINNEEWNTVRRLIASDRLQRSTAD